MALQIPFDVIGVDDFPVHPIEIGVEYIVIDISPDGSKFQAKLPDGTLGWFPAKCVRIVETPSRNQRPQQQQQYATYTQSSMGGGGDDARRREHEAAKKQAAEKERRRLELQKKLKQQQTLPRRIEADVDEEEVDEASRQLERMKTYTETRGYLSTAPGFNRDLAQYIDDEEEIAVVTPPKKTETQTSPAATKTTTSNAGVYRKIEERSDGPKYVPNDELPAQYTTGPWKCHSCHQANTADKLKCGMCGTQRGEKSQSLASTSTAPGVEWTCVSCKVPNAPTRDNCVMCGTKYKPPSNQEKDKGAKKDDKGPKKTPTGPVKKKAIVTKAGSGVELQYAKGVDNYKTGGVIPGHGAGY
jgi:hypothetical protein